MHVEFDGSFDGFLSLIHACYYEKIAPTHIQEAEGPQLSLSFDLYPVQTCATKAAKVQEGIRKKISAQAALQVHNAFLSYQPHRFLAILQYVQLGFKVGHMVDSHLQTPCVATVHQLARQVGGEAHLLTGFSRFVETENGVFYSPITPKNNVLPLVAAHFSARFGSHPWVLHDKKRGQAALYDGESYLITPVPQEVTLALAPGEEDMQQLWKGFLKALTIESRKNPKLQRQLLPLYFRKNMTEFL